MNASSWHRTVIVSMALLAVVICLACSGGSPPEHAETTAVPMARAVVVGRLVDEVMVPGYQRVETTTQALADAVAALCAAPSAASRGSAREAWRDANTAWNRTAAYRFGPAMDKASAVDYPIDAAKAQDLLDSTKPPTPFTPESLGALGADVRGLEAIEMVLFSPAASDDPGVRQCSYGQAAAQIVTRAAKDVRTAWVDPVGGKRSYAEQLKTPGADSELMNEQQVITEIVNGSISALGSVSDKRLGRASGEVTGTPLPADTDAGLAHTALSDATEMVDSVHDVVVGQGGQGGLRSMLDPQSRTGASLVAALDDAVEAIQAIRSPLASVPPSDVAAVKNANLYVRGARLVLRTEVASQLGVTLTFSDSDGDS